VGGLLGVLSGIWRTCHRDAPAEVSRPPTLTIRMFETRRAPNFAQVEVSRFREPDRSGVSVVGPGKRSRPLHKLLCIPAVSLIQLEAPDAYRQVPRRVLGKDGQVRTWQSG
jgi:hypothetical protein